MASLILTSCFINCFFFFTLVSTFFTIKGENFAEEFYSESILMGKPQKASTLHFYFHDIVGGKNPSAKQIAGPTPSKSGTASSFFGTTMIIDDPLTIGPELTSKLVGRAQGIYSFASQEEFGLLMTLNFVFVEGKYNGSTLSILGRNPVMNKVREMPIVGGSGLFRYARGYALAKTVWSHNNGDALVQYNVSVIHY